MKIAEDQKKQFIVLCCLVVFVLGYAVFKIIGSGSHAQTRQTQTTAKTSAATTDANKVDVGEPVDNVALAPAAAGETEARDPFIPQIGESAPANTRPTRMSLPPPVFPSGKLSSLSPLMPPMPFNREITVTTQNPPAREPDPDPSQTLRLTGVIQGAVNVAILRGPDNARYIVREGQVIDGKYRVDLVTRFGVRLSFNNRSYLLSLGGSDAQGAQ